MKFKLQVINNPKISVIIPIYNCEKTIELSLKSIYFQNTTTEIKSNKMEKF